MKKNYDGFASPVFTVQVEVSSANSAAANLTEIYTCMNSVPTGGGGRLIFPANQIISISAPVGYGLSYLGQSFEFDLNGCTLIATSGWFTLNTHLYLHDGTLLTPAINHMTQGVVEEVNSSWFDFLPTAGFAPVTGWTTAQTYVEVDLNKNAVVNKRDHDGTTQYAIGPSPLGSGRYRCTVAPATWLANGKKIVIFKQKYGSSGIFDGGSKGTYSANVPGKNAKLILQNLRIIGTPGMFLNNSISRDIEIENVYSDYEDIDGERAWMSINADFLHIAAPQGDVSITDVFPAGCGDDGLNIYTKYWEGVTIVPGQPAVDIQTYLRAPDPGDLVEFLDPAAVTQATLKIASVVIDQPGGAGTTINGYRVTFETSLPAAFNPATWVLLNQADLPESVSIDGFHVTRNNARGLIIHTRRAIVTNFGVRGALGGLINIAKGTSGYIEGDASAETVLIDNYYSEDSGFVNGLLIGAHQINVQSLSHSGNTAGVGPNRGIIIGQGRVVRCGYGVLSTRGGGTTVRGLEFADTGGKRTGGTDGDWDVHIYGGQVDLRDMLAKDEDGSIKIMAGADVTLGLVNGFATSSLSPTTEVEALVVPPGGGRNIFFNPFLDVAQSYAPVTGASAFQFLPIDLFEFGSTGTSGNFDIARQDFPDGQTDVPNDPTAFMRVIQNTVPIAGRGFLHGFVGNAETLSSQHVVFSFYGRLAVGTHPSSSLTILADLMQTFGAGGSPTVYGIAYQTLQLTNDWQRFTLSGVMPSVSGKTIGAGNSLKFRLYAAAVDQDFYGDFTGFKVERGIFPTTIVSPPTAEAEYLCKRYYERSLVRTINGSSWITCLPKVATPAISTTAGSVANATVNGCLLTHTTSANATITFDARI